MVEDLERRINSLFDALNCETLSKSVVDQLLILAGGKLRSELMTCAVLISRVAEQPWRRATERLRCLSMLTFLLVVRRRMTLACGCLLSNSSFCACRLLRRVLEMRFLLSTGLFRYSFDVQYKNILTIVELFE